MKLHFRQGRGRCRAPTDGALTLHHGPTRLWRAVQSIRQARG
nr:MAG TPA: hypothetical protein [Bacteriophage sp.]